MFNHDSSTHLTDQLSAFGKEMHYMFEVPHRDAFLQAWLGEKNAAQVWVVPMELKFRDNADFSSACINIVTLMGTVSEYEALEEDTPEIQQYTRLNRLDTQSYFLHDPMEAPVFRDKPEKSKYLIDELVFVFTNELLEKDFQPFTIGMNYTVGTYEAQGANMRMALYHINDIDVSYVMLSPVLNGMAVFRGNDRPDEAEVKDIKFKNELASLALMQKFCDEGLLKPMTEMPLQFIQSRLQSTPRLS